MLINKFRRISNDWLICVHASIIILIDQWTATGLLIGLGRVGLAAAQEVSVIKNVPT